ncbi:glutamyl-tRNA amidotransferase subunit A [Babesia ovis]|uniref:Glutamyl-tRNA amidotransferase subunit A n=1 Tax=Babesia ovis TaxID=5869 RepID=A0A9W5WU55_BABOV|nr:glutamyl-tRNA amidotransferase subunit A [Babesia ovis]
MKKSPDDIDPESRVRYSHLTHPSHKYTLAPGFRVRDGECIAYFAILIHILCLLYAIGFVRAASSTQPAWITGLRVIPSWDQNPVISKQAAIKYRQGRCASKSTWGTATSDIKLDECAKKAIEEFLSLTVHLQQSSQKAKNAGQRYLEQRLRNICNGVDNSNLADEFGLTKYRSFTHIVDDGQLVAQVQEVMQRYKQGGHKMRLLGEPIAVKDNLSIQGIPYTNGSPLFEGYTPSYTAKAIKRLQQEGAIIIGKTVMDEFGVGASTVAARNPYSSERLAGGSSGGSASVVGGGIINIAMGTDTGGSVRVPSAYCGCVGYRPSHGLVSRYGLSELAAKLDTVGACTKTVTDTIKVVLAMMDTCTEDMADPDVSKHVAQQLEDILESADTVPGDNPLRGVKIASLDLEALQKEDILDPTIAANMREVEDALRKLGAEVVSIPPLSLTKVAENYHVYVAAQMASNMQRFADHQYHPQKQHIPFDQMVQQMGKTTVARMQTGITLLQRGFNHERMLTETRDYIAKWMDQYGVFSEYSLLLTPTSMQKPPLLSAVRGTPTDCIKDDLYTTLAPLIGACAIAIPTGMSNDNLPFSAQLTASQFSDGLLLRAAHAYQTHVPIRMGTFTNEAN